MGCTAFAILLIGISLILVPILFKLLSSPRFQEKALQMRRLEECIKNLKDLRSALERYREATGDYPSQLEDLRPLYLKDPSILHCPNDPRPPATTSYQYQKPLSPQPDTPLLTCPWHPHPPSIRLDGRIEFK